MPIAELSFKKFIYGMVALLEANCTIRLAVLFLFGLPSSLNPYGIELL